MKERLTEAALDLIWHNSYGATSVDAICERAGAAKGSFYYFFKSKSELAAAALEADWRKRKVDMDQDFFPDGCRLWRDWRATLILCTTAWLNFKRIAGRCSGALYLRLAAR